MKYVLGIEVLLFVLMALIALNSHTGDTDNDIANSFFDLLIGSATAILIVVYLGMSFWYHQFY